MMKQQSSKRAQKKEDINSFSSASKESLLKDSPKQKKVTQIIVEDTANEGKESNTEWAIHKN